MKLWEQLLRRPSTDPARGLTVNDWAQFFGPEYAPFLQQSWAPDKEQKSFTAAGSYKSNGPVFSLVQARMQVFAQARFAWTRFKAGMPGDLWGTSELAILERPWVGGTTADLLARMEFDASTAGTAFVRRINAQRLSCLRPQWVTVVIGSNEEADHPNEASDAEIVGYIYQPPSGRGIILEPHEVALYAPLPDPDNHFLGMSWITPVLQDVAADDSSTAHKRKLFENAATPNFAIKFDPTTTIDQVKAFKELIESEHRGLANAYKTLYLGGGADPVTVGMNFQQMDFAVTQGKGESRLASAAGVPPSWVGFSEGLQGSALNAGNFTAARRRFGDGTMHHLWGNAAASLEPLLKRPDAATSLWYDVRGVPFMREDAKDAAEVQTKEASTITALIRDGFTAESAIAAVENNDWSLLKHTGLISVQLQEPGVTAPGTTPNGPPAPTEGEE